MRFLRSPLFNCSLSKYLWKNHRNSLCQRTVDPTLFFNKRKSVLNMSTQRSLFVKIELTKQKKVHSEFANNFHELCSQSDSNTKCYRTFQSHPDVKEKDFSKPFRSIGKPKLPLNFHATDDLFVFIHQTTSKLSKVWESLLSSTCACDTESIRKWCQKRFYFALRSNSLKKVS